jgi:hypothetical protein
MKTGVKATAASSSAPSCGVAAWGGCQSGVGRRVA